MTRTHQVPARGPTALEPGRTLLDRYQVLEWAAQGGMGEVYRARDLLLNREVALKRLRPEYATQADARRRFEREALAAASLSHPNIVTVHDVGTDQDAVPFIVLEWLDGPTFADEIAHGPVPAERVRIVAAEVLSALGAAHAHGILHRDVKPSNILIDRDGVAKLADFGIAKALDAAEPLTVTGAVVGTVCYLAPERLRGDAATPASDLYSLGVVLYEALSGEQPFNRGGPAQVAHAVTTDQPASLVERGVDDEDLAAVVERTMAKEPTARYPSAAAMSAALATTGPSSGAAPAAAAAVPLDPRDQGSAAHAPTDVAAVPTPIHPTAVRPGVDTTRAAARELARSRTRGVAMVAALLAVLGVLLVAALTLASRQVPLPDPPTSSTPPTAAAPPSVLPASTTTPTTAASPSTQPSPPTQPAPPDNGGKGKPGRGKGNKD